MDKALKKKWVAALRSGKYRQGRGKLRTGTSHGGHAKYCCLGVLCEVVGVHRIGDSFYEYEYDGSSYLLPLPLRDKLMVYSDIQEVLVNMNDRGESFRTIADWIEENL